MKTFPFLALFLAGCLANPLPREANDTGTTGTTGPRVECVTTHIETTGELRSDLLGVWTPLFDQIDSPAPLYDLREGGVLRIVQPGWNASVSEGQWDLYGNTLYFETSWRFPVGEIAGIYPAAMDMDVDDHAILYARMKCDGFGFEGGDTTHEPTCAEPDGPACEDGLTCIDYWVGAACARGAPRWGASPVNLEFGEVHAGESKTLMIELWSDGSGTAEIHGVDLPDDFSVSPSPTPTDPIRLPPNSQTTMEVTLNSTAQWYRSRLTLKGRLKKTSISMVANFPCLEIQGPSAYDFGEVPIGETRTVSHAVRNCGVPDSTLSQAELVGDGSFGGALPTTPFILQDGEVKEYTITFSPRTPGQFSTSARFEDGERSAWAQYSGTGVP